MYLGVLIEAYCPEMRSCTGSETSTDLAFAQFDCLGSVLNANQDQEHAFGWFVIAKLWLNAVQSWSLLARSLPGEAGAGRPKQPRGADASVFCSVWWLVQPRAHERTDELHRGGRRCLLQRMQTLQWSRARRAEKASNIMSQCKQGLMSSKFL